MRGDYTFMRALYIYKREYHVQDVNIKVVVRMLAVSMSNPTFEGRSKVPCDINPSPTSQSELEKSTQ